MVQVRSRKIKMAPATYQITEIKRNGGAISVTLTSVETENRAPHSKTFGGILADQVLPELVAGWNVGDRVAEVAEQQAPTPIRAEPTNAQVQALRAAYQQTMGVPMPETSDYSIETAAEDEAEDASLTAETEDAASIAATGFTGKQLAALKAMLGGTSPATVKAATTPTASKPAAHVNGAVIIPKGMKSSTIYPDLAVVCGRAEQLSAGMKAGQLLNVWKSADGQGFYYSMQPSALGGEKVQSFAGKLAS